MVEPSRKPPYASGSSFVDLGLKTVVQSASATLLSFQPQYLHGTTATDGVKTLGLSMVSSKRVFDAYQELLNKGKNIFKSESSSSDSTSDEPED
jgi:hypothetical protein